MSIVGSGNLASTLLSGLMGKEAVAAPKPTQVNPLLAGMERKGLTSTPTEGGGSLERIFSGMGGDGLGAILGRELVGKGLEKGRKGDDDDAEEGRQGLKQLGEGMREALQEMREGMKGLSKGRGKGRGNGGMPPGLAKKGGLPPGIAKKMGVMAPGNKPVEGAKLTGGAPGSLAELAKLAGGAGGPGEKPQGEDLKKLGALAALAGGGGNPGAKPQGGDPAILQQLTQAVGGGGGATAKLPPGAAGPLAELERGIAVAAAQPRTQPNQPSPLDPFAGNSPNLNSPIISTLAGTAGPGAVLDPRLVNSPTALGASPFGPPIGTPLPGQANPPNPLDGVIELYGRGDGVAAALRLFSNTQQNSLASIGQLRNLGLA